MRSPAYPASDGRCQGNDRLSLSFSEDACSALRALAHDQLDTDQLASRLQLAPFAVRLVMAELAGAGLVASETVGDPRRQVWRLTLRGRQAVG